MNDLVMEADMNGKIINISPHVKRITGYEPEERLGKSAFDLVHPDDVTLVLKAAKEGWNTGRANVSYRLRHKNGEWIRLECSGTTFMGEYGTRHSTIVIRNINNRALPKA
jgi:PAS domain S-box-containing protein